MSNQSHTSTPAQSSDVIQIQHNPGSQDGQSTKDGAAFLQTLYLADPHHDREELLKFKGAVAQHTCSWILSTAEFTRWRHRGPDSKDLLWICGSQGSGKTMLSIYISKYLEGPLDPQGNSPSSHARKNLFLYFFCNASDTRKSSETGILRCLLFQALRQRPDLMCHAQQIYEQQRRPTPQDWFFDMLWLALRAIILEIPSQDVSG